MRNKQYQVGIYCRLSKDDNLPGESMSIGTQRSIISDGFDSENDNNDIAPFKNILNDMYARDISRKVKTAKLQRAKQGLFISSQAPYGYKKDSENKNHLVIDEEAAQIVRQIFKLALEGLGEVNIAKELCKRRILKPAAYKFRRGDTRFAEHGDMEEDKLFKWCPATVRTILGNQMYLGHMINHRTETVNYKTKKQRSVPPEEQIVVYNTHEAIVSQEVFDQVWSIRKSRWCPADQRRDNLFRGLLFCSCCGSVLSIAHRKLTHKEDDVYRCMKHIYKPEECPKTHAIYHEELYAYILSQVKGAARSMKRRKINSPIAAFAEIEELTPKVLTSAIERIEVGHLTRKSRLSTVVKIQWKLS